MRQDAPKNGAQLFEITSTSGQTHAGVRMYLDREQCHSCCKLHLAKTLLSAILIKIAESSLSLQECRPG